MSEQILNIKFVEEVEKHPVLYNYKLPDYSRKDITEKAWYEVGREVHMTGSECKKRWKNLRAVFVRNMKPALNGSGSKNKKPYYLEEAMQFSIPYIKALNTTTKENMSHIRRKEKDQQYSDIDTEESRVIEDSLPLSSSQPQLPLPPLNSSPAIQQDENHQNGRQSHLLNDDRTFMEYFQDKKAGIVVTPDHITRLNQRSEALKMFLLSMLPDLELMTDDQIRQFKRKSLETIDEIMSQHS